MAKKEVKLVVCDIEGCLTMNKSLPIDLGSLTKTQGYCELARRGNKPPFVLCTGRPQAYAEAIIQALDAFFPNFPSIVENGCFLYDPVEDVLLENPAIAGKKKKLANIRAMLIEAYVEKNKAKLEPGKEICLSLNPVGGQSVKSLFEEIQGFLSGELEMVFVTHSSSAVDITPRGINKASGLSFLSQRTEIPFEDMLGIGDTTGDIPFLNLVGIPACPANASPEVIKLVNEKKGYVSKVPYTGGVWDILVHHQLIK